MRALWVMVFACSSPAKAPAEFPPLPGEGSPAPTAAAIKPDPKCIREGIYEVAVDLSAAKITQANTGMGDTAWCESMLQGVASTQMNKLIVGYEAGNLIVLWGRRATVTVRGSCELEVTSPPMPARLIFADRGATGTSTFSVGTTNHPDESCTATDAKLALTAIIAP